MSFKKLLGLESFPINEVEILRRIQEARRHKRQEIEFISQNKTVKVKLHILNPEGIMRGNQDYYA